MAFVTPVEEHWLEWWNSAMGPPWRIDPMTLTHYVIFNYVWDGAYKRSLAANWKTVAYEVAAADFLSHYFLTIFPISYNHT